MGQIKGFEKFISSRRSIRLFEREKISWRMIEKIIEIGILAPTASNLQGWKFILIDNLAPFFSPSGILVLYDNRTSNREYNDDIVSAGMAIQNMLLMAHNLGVGSCVVCDLPPKKKLRHTYHIPECFDPIAYIALGFSKQKAVVPKRKYDLDDVWNFDRFTFNVETKCRNPVKKIIRKVFPQKQKYWCERSGTYGGVSC